MRLFPAHAVRFSERAFLALLPHGGQHRSRTNAWQAMVADRRRAADRAAADHAFAAARGRAATDPRLGRPSPGVAAETRQRALAGAD